MDEVMARIIVCPWNRRLWMWQGAFLARHSHLFFQFKEGPIGDQEILDACEGNSVITFSQLVDWPLS